MSGCGAGIRPPQRKFDQANPATDSVIFFRGMGRAPSFLNGNFALHNVDCE
jgi:hypothetical protein